jgi:ABC-type Fe3+ transport system substrate-binding protein
VTRVGPQVIPWFGRTASLQPRSWDEYLGPEYAGCVLSTAETWYVTLVAARGAAGAEAWLEAFFANGGVVGDRSTVDVRRLLAGEIDCLVFAPLRDLAGFAREGVEVGWFAPESTSAATYHAQVLASTSRPHAAALFVRWLAGPEGARLYAQAGELPVSPSAEPAEGLAPWVDASSEEFARLRIVPLDDVTDLQGVAADLFERWVTPRLAG